VWLRRRAAAKGLEKCFWFSQKREIEELQRRVDKLESISKTLDIEWSSTYDKFRSILARIAKAQEREEATAPMLQGLKSRVWTMPSRRLSRLLP